MCLFGQDVDFLFETFSTSYKYIMPPAWFGRATTGGWATTGWEPITTEPMERHRQGILTGVGNRQLLWVFLCSIRQQAAYAHMQAAGICKQQQELQAYAYRLQPCETETL